jgi:hypothetical protein
MSKSHAMEIRGHENPSKIKGSDRRYESREKIEKIPIFSVILSQTPKIIQVEMNFN